jgi:hypothetical protein
MKKISIFLSGIILLFFFYSCRKNTTIDLNPDVNVSNDVILSVSSYTAVFNLLIKARLDPFLAAHGHAMIDSANISYDSLKMEYDFDFFLALSPDSIRRSGTIVVLLSGDILQKGSYARIFFQDYYEDDGRVDAIDSITNEGVNVFGQVVFSENISRGLINKAIGFGTISIDMTGRYKILASSLVPGQDILFLVKGNISGLSSKGYIFSASIHDTLEDSFSCPWIRDGIMDVHVPDAEIPDGYIDFISSDGCSDLIWYYFDTSAFKVRKNQFYLKN